jgi:hypothetical protein
MTEEDGKKQLLHLVFGGELKKLGSTVSSAISTGSTSSASILITSLRIIAWKAKAQAERRQCAYALFRRSHAPAARPGNGCGDRGEDGRLKQAACIRARGRPRLQPEWQRQAE